MATTTSTTVDTYPVVKKFKKLITDPTPQAISGFRRAVEGNPERISRLRMHYMRLSRTEEQVMENRLKDMGLNFIL